MARMKVRDMGDKQRKAVMAKLSGDGEGEDKDTFDSDAQRKGFFGKVKQVKDSDNRSDHAKAVDAALTAKKVHPFTEKGIKKWKRNPEQTDLKYVDTPVIVKRAKKTKKEIKKVRVEVEKVEEKEKAVIHKAKIRKIRREHKRKKLTGVEIENLKKLADKRGIERDLVDFDAIIDPTLNYHENKDMIEDYLKGVSKKKFSLTDELSKLESQFKSYINELEYRAKNAKDKAERIEIKNQIFALTGQEPEPVPVAHEITEKRQQRDRLTHVLDITRELEREFNAPVMKSEIVEKGMKEGLSESQVEESIDRLKMDGQIYDPNRNERYKIV
jgi:hypothetical protein